MANTATPFKPPSRRDAARKVLLSHLREKRVGDRLPPLKQLARELNVGESNLMGAMRELRRAGIVYSRKRVGTYVAKQTPPRDAGALAGKTITLVSMPSDDMIVRMITAATKSLRDQGATVTTEHVDWEQPEAVWSRCATSDLMVTFNPALTSKWLHLLDGSDSRPPMVAISTSWSRGIVGGFDYDLVGIDQEEIGRLVGERMRQGGHRSACFIGMRAKQGDAYTELSQARLRGFERGLGVAVRPEHQIRSLGYSLLSGGMAVPKYVAMADRPHAVFAASDELAVGFWIGAAGQDLTAGEDFDLMGVDGLDLGRKQAAGPLATIELPAEEMGRAGARLVAQRLTNPDAPPQTHIMPCKPCEGVTLKALKGRSPDA